MLRDKFNEVYDKFKLNFYKSMFKKINNREASLTAMETFTVEVINILNNPRVSDVTEFLDLSHPNMAYRISSLVNKGYIEKHQSDEDKREYYLVPTEKFYRYNNIKEEYIDIVVRRMEERFTKEELKILEKIFRITSDELMPEVTDFINKHGLNKDN